MTEHLADLGDDILAEAVVRRRRHHASVLAHPLIVAGGEVQLRNRLDAEHLQIEDFLLQNVFGPRALARNFRMALILQPFADVQHQRIAACRRQRLCRFVPEIQIKAQMILRADLRQRLRNARNAALVPHGIRPHIVAQMRKKRPPEFRLIKKYAVVVHEVSLRSPSVCRMNAQPP